jgi:hypothetical protein
MPEAKQATGEKQNKAPKQRAPQAIGKGQGGMGASGALSTMDTGVLLAMMEPGQAAIGSILSLQRLSGNRAVTGHLQTKLTVGPTSDRYEQEADRVAEQVLAMPVASPSVGAPATQRLSSPEAEEVQTKPLAAGITPLQRAPDEEEEVQTKPLAANITPLQRAPQEEEEVQTKPLLQRAPEDEDEVQTKRGRTGSDGSFEAGDSVEARLDASRGGGSPLPGNVRAFMEPRFGADFGGVRVHDGAEAASLNRQISAQAFTHANDVYMGEGRYTPGTTAGNRLLAHELAHVVQQTGGDGLRRAPGFSTATGPLVQRDGGKKFTGEVPRTGEDSEEYTRFLQANPDMLSDKERPFAKFLVSSKKPERGPKPPTGESSDAYVKYLLANPDLLSEKEKIFFKVYTGQDVPDKPKPEEEESGPPEPSKWEQFKALFKKKPATAIDLLVKQLTQEFKGYAGVKGFFTGTRKAQALLTEQHGVLTEAQERSIDMLAALDPSALTKLGFLLPSQAESKAHEFLLKPEGMADLNAKQQMQIITFQHRFPIGAPKPASKHDKELLESLKGPKPKPETGPKTENLEQHAKETVEKRQETPPTTTKSELPERVEPKGGMPSLSNVIIKPGKWYNIHTEKGAESVSHNVNAYRDAAADMVRSAQLHRGTIGQTAEQLTTDYIDVDEGRNRWHELDDERGKVLEQLKGAPVKPAKPRKDLHKRLDWVDKSQDSLAGALHENDFDKAANDAKFRAEGAQKSSVKTTQETATIEYLYDEVQKRKDEIAAREKKATRAQKKDANFNLETARLKAKAADDAKPMVQQARMSHDVIDVARLSTDGQKTYVQKTLDRFPGALRKLGGTIVAGVLSGIVGTLTFGLVGIKGNTSAKGYMGKGLEKKGWPIKATFLNDIRNQIAQFKTAISARPGGPSVLDVTSAVLRAFNEIILQNVINISGKLALITGLLATALSALSAVTFGATAPVAAIFATISSICTYVALIAAAVKALVSAVRFTLDGLSMLLNQDAKVSNFMRARAKQSGMETMGDVTQLAGSALGTPTGQVIKGNEFVNMFDPTKIINMNVSALTSTGVSIGQTVGATVTSTAIGTGAPLIMGSVAQGIKGAVDEQYSLHTQHTDDLGPRPQTKMGGGFLPPSHQKGRLQSPQMKGPGSTPVDPTMPEWIRKAMEEQNTLRANVYKGNTARAVGEITGISSKAGELANKLGMGKDESTKLDEQVKEGQTKDKSGEVIDPESVEMSKQQNGILSDSHGAVGGALEFLAHSKTEVKKLAEEPKPEPK